MDKKEILYCVMSLQVVYVISEILARLSVRQNVKGFSLSTSQKDGIKSRIECGSLCNIRKITQNLDCNAFKFDPNLNECNLGVIYENEHFSGWVYGNTFTLSSLSNKGQSAPSDCKKDFIFCILHITKNFPVVTLFFTLLLRTHMTSNTS